MNSLLIKNANVVLPDEVKLTSVLIDDGIISAIGYQGKAEREIDAKGNYLLAGFIDIHVHGGGNKSAMSTNYRDIIDMAEAHLKHGTTSIVPTTLASPISQLKDVTLSIKEASENGTYKIDSNKLAEAILKSLR